MIENIHDTLNDIESNKLVITRELMFDVVYSVHYFNGPFVSIDDIWELRERAWSLGRPSWMHVLFDLLIHPVADFDPPEGWEGEIYCFLNQIAMSYPDESFVTALSYFSTPVDEVRTAVISILCCTQKPEALPWLNKVADDLKHCSIDTLVSLAEAYKCLYVATREEEALQRVSTIRQYIPVGQSEALDDEINQLFTYAREVESSEV